VAIRDGDLDRLGSVPVEVSVEIGRIRVPVNVLLDVAEGSVFQLEKHCRDPLDVKVNGEPFAKGEAAVVGEHFAVRLLGLAEGTDEAAAPTATPGESAGSAVSQESAEGRNFVGEVEDLPSLPRTHEEILKLGLAPDFSAEAAAESVQMDPRDLAAVFRLANALGFSAGERVSSIPAAISALGLEAFANLVLAVQVHRALSDYDGGAGLDREAFWVHAAGTAFVARAVANKLQLKSQPAFLGGFLHDIGKLVLDHWFPADYGPVLDRVKAENSAYEAAESGLLDGTHAEVGGQLALAWRLPNVLASCIAWHHRPGGAERFERMVAVVHLADVLTHRLTPGGRDGEVDPRVLERFSMQASGLGILSREAEAELVHAETFAEALGQRRDW